MNYEEKYKEMKKRVLAIGQGYVKEVDYNSPRSIAEYIDPELKESEDEKWRNWLIGHLKGYINQTDDKYAEVCKKVIAWLEKQGEQKYTEKQDYSGLNDFERAIHRGFLCTGMENVPVAIIKETAKDCIAEIKSLEIGCEQKPTDEVKPKFKVGDTVTVKPMACHGKVFKGKPFKIVDLIEDNYVSDDGKTYSISLQDGWELVEQNLDWSEDDEQNLKFWLDNNKSIDFDKRNWLKSLKDRVQSQSHQEWSKEDSERLVRIYKFIWANRKGDTDEIYQQEQDADWLMALKPQPKQEWNEEDEKMWSQVINEIDAIKSNSSTIFEKNIAQDKIDWLKSIKDRVQPKPKQEWSEKDEHCIELLLPIIDSSSLIPKNRKKCKEFLKSLKDRVQPQSKQEWSEEDGKMLTSTIEYLSEFREVYQKGAQECIAWLKSLKPHWKPSEEQLSSLGRFIEGVYGCVDFTNIKSLYNDIKNL